MLASVSHNNKVTGYAYTGKGYALVPTRGKYMSGEYGYNTLIAHELGHSVLGLEHVSESAPKLPCNDIWPLMDRRVCAGMWSPNTLNNAVIRCEQRQQLHWPCSTSGIDNSEDDLSQSQYPFRNNGNPGTHEYKCQRFNHHTEDGLGYILTGTGDIDP